MENPLRTVKLGAKEERLDKPLAHKSVKGLSNLIELILDGLSFYKGKFFSSSIIFSHATVITLFNQI
jgi:hypothetical protein